ncbi:MAG: HAMP domain-containing protein [Elusimicrobiota bacterium]
MYKRKNYLTEKKYQIKYTSVIILAMLIVAVVIGAATYWDISSNLSVEQAIDLMQWDKYIIRIILLIAAASIAGIFLSHKIIGPIHRLEDAIEELNNGEFDVKLKLRSGDEFSNLAEQVNTLSTRLKKYSKDHPELKNNFKQQK